MARSDEDDPRQVFYQSTYGGWTDKTEGMLATGARLHLALGDATSPGRVAGGLTHASFFSGAGGLDLGLERAGWSTVSVSEIDPYASAVLASRWPSVPNLGDIVELAGRARAVLDGGPDDTRPDWTRALLFSGGFPCQDLSVAGKRRGFTGQRSSLAFAFLDLVELYRPAAILLENVPGLLTSHRGRDLATLFGRLVDLGYGVAYRVLDARLFGVPQRRQRVFIVGVRGAVDDPQLDLAAERAAQVLAVGAFCDRHPPASSEAGKESARRTKGGAGVHGSAADGATATRTIGANTGHHGYALGTQDLDGGYLQVVDDVAATLNSGGNAGGFRTEPGAHLVVDDVGALPASLGKGLGHNKDGHIVAFAPDDARGEAGRRQGPADSGGPLGRAGYGRQGDAVLGAGGPPVDAARMREADGLAGRLDDSDGLDGSVFVKVHHAEDADDAETWEGDDVTPTLSVDATREARVTTLIASSSHAEDPLLPKGLDSHRYRCCGNGVVTPVAEWLGSRLVEWAVDEGYA